MRPYILAFKIAKSNKTKDLELLKAYIVITFGAEKSIFPE